MKRIFFALVLFSIAATGDTPPIIYKFNAPLVKTSNRIISIPKADATHDGYLSQLDFLSFYNNLLPSQTGNNGKALFTNGSTTFWGAAAGSGTVTNVSSGDGSIDVTNPTTVPDIRVHFPMSAASGTVSAPAYGTAGAGMYGIGFGVLGFSTLGTERLRLENNGSVVIANGGSGSLTVNGPITATGNISAANYPPIGNANTLAQYNASGSLTASYWNVSPDNNGLSNISSINGSYVDLTQFKVQTNITGTNTGVTRGAYFNLDGTGSSNASVQGFAMDLNIPSDDNLYGFNANVGNASVVSGSVYGLNLGLDAVVSGAETAINIGTTNTIAGNYNGIFINNGASVAQDASMYSGSNYGSTTGTLRLIDVQNSGAIGFDFRGANVNNNGTVAGWASGLSVNTSGNITKGWDSYASNINASVGNGTGTNLNFSNFSISPGHTIDGSVYGLSLSNQSTVSGSVNVLSLNNSGNHQGILGVNVYNNGTMVGNNTVQGGYVNQAAAGYNFIGWSAYVNASQAEGVKGFQFSQDSANSRYAYGLDLNMSGSITDEAVGINVNMTGISNTSKRFSTIQTGGGTLSIGSSYPLRPGTFVDVGNYVSALATTPTNISGADNFVQMFQSNLQATNDIAVGPLGLGTNLIGQVAQVQVDSGKTIDLLHGLIVGASLNAGSGGTITDYAAVEILGLPSFGGSASIGTLTMLQDSQILGQALCDGATTCYGVRVRDGRAQNSFAGGVTLSTSGTQPTCDAAHRGQMWNVEGGAGVADVLQVCQKDASDNYVWTNH